MLCEIVLYLKTPLTGTLVIQVISDGVLSLGGATKPQEGIYQHLQRCKCDRAHFGTNAADEKSAQAVALTCMLSLLQAN